MSGNAKFDKGAGQGGEGEGKRRRGKGGRGEKSPEVDVLRGEEYGMSICHHDDPRSLS